MVVVAKVRGKCLNVHARKSKRAMVDIANSSSSPASKDTCRLCSLVQSSIALAYVQRSAVSPLRDENRRNDRQDEVNGLQQHSHHCCLTTFRAISNNTTRWNDHETKHVTHNFVQCTVCTFLRPIGCFMVAREVGTGLAGTNDYVVAQLSEHLQASSYR